MPSLLTKDVTSLLHAWFAGDEQALGILIDAVYQDLRGAAHTYMVGEKPGHLLRTVALVHEVYLRPVDVRRMTFQIRVQFLARCARLAWRILGDFARSRGCPSFARAAAGNLIPAGSRSDYAGWRLRAATRSRQQEEPRSGLALVWRFERQRNSDDPERTAVYSHAEMIRSEHHAA